MRYLTIIFQSFAICFVLGTLSSAIADEARGVTLITVNSLADPGTGGCDAAQCTLREAVALAASTADDQTIEFEPGLSGTITLGSTLTINSNGVTINGPGPDVIQLSGNAASRVLRLQNTDAVVLGLTIRDGNSGSDSGGGIRIDGSGEPLLENLRIINNSTTGQGAGIFLFFSGATLRNLEISDNIGATSPLLINGSEGDNVLVENVTISGNVSNQQAAGLRVLTNTGQTVSLRYLTVVNNSGGSAGAIISGTNGVTNVEASLFCRQRRRRSEFLQRSGQRQQQRHRRPR